MRDIRLGLLGPRNELILREVLSFLFFINRLLESDLVELDLFTFLWFRPSHSFFAFSTLELFCFSGSSLSLCGGLYTVVLFTRLEKGVGGKGGTGGETCLTGTVGSGY
jgi:hypothetical protein